MSDIRLIGLGAAFGAAFSFSASAQLACAPHAAITEQLERSHGERLNASGITASGALVELYRAPHGKSWTLILALPDGRACLMAAGNQWGRRIAPPPRKGKGA